LTVSYLQEQLETALEGIMLSLQKNTVGVAIYPGFDHERGSGNPIMGPLSQPDLKILEKKSIQVPSSRITFPLLP